MQFLLPLLLEPRHAFLILRLVPLLLLLLLEFVLQALGLLVCRNPCGRVCRYHTRRLRLRWQGFRILPLGNLSRKDGRIQHPAGAVVVVTMILLRLLLLWFPLRHRLLASFSRNLSDLVLGNIDGDTASGRFRSRTRFLLCCATRRGFGRDGFWFLLARRIVQKALFESKELF